MEKQCGFSLIELMIALAIVAILAGIAWPSYQEQVRTSRRADAQGALMGLAQAMERHLTSSGTYEGAAVLDGNAANLGAPRIFPDQAPISGGTKFYNLRIVEPTTATLYTLQAQPIGSQAGDGALQLDSIGHKFWDRNNQNGFESSEMCWDRGCN